MLLALPLSLAGRTAEARPRSKAPAEDPTIDPALEASRELYEEGRARFETFDYEGAADLWTKAYAKLPADAAGIRNQLVYNIATAQQKAYDVDHDLGHLRRALLLLRQYVAGYEALHDHTELDEAELEQANARIVALEQHIARAEAGEDQSPEPGDSPRPTTEDGIDPAAPSESPDPPLSEPTHYGSGAIDGIVWTTPRLGAVDADALRRNRALSSEDRKTDRMLIGSYVALSLGGALTLAGTGAALGTRNDGAGARGGSYGALGLGLAGLTTGFALLGIGLDRRKKARQGTLVSGAPVVGPGLAGAAVVVRF